MRKVAKWNPLVQWLVRPPRFAASLIVGISILAFGNVARSAPYVFVDLGAGRGGESFAYGINNAGTVVGQAVWREGAFRATRWDGGLATDLQLASNPEDPVTQGTGTAFGINDSGRVIGTRRDVTGIPHATRWDGDVQTSLGAFGPGTDSQAYAVNQQGVGVAVVVAPAKSYAYVWKDNLQIPLKSLGFDNTQAKAINNLGQIVGWSDPAFGPRATRAVSWNSEEPDEVTIIGDIGTRAYGNNDKGEVVGSLSTDGATDVPMLWDGSIALKLSTFGGGTAIDINNAGQSVGYSYVDEYQNRRAVMWSGAGQIDLNTFLDRDTISIGWYLMEANAINDSGWIVGTARNSVSGERHAFLLMSAVPDLDSSILLSIGLLVLAGVARRRGNLRSQ